MIEKYSKEVIRELRNIRFKDEKLCGMLSYALGSGQRLRPILTTLSCRAVGGNPAKVLAAAAAVELLHKFTLVHDDIVDKDEFRRGNPTFHAKYGWKYAIFMGDFLCARVFTILEKLDLEYDDKILLDCYKILSDTYNKLCIGELEELVSSEKKFIIEKEYLEIVTLKSASLLESSMKLGAVLGGGTRGEITALSQYGKYFALSMQTLNDIKDTIGLEKRRKEKGPDIQEGKWNTLLIHAVENAPKNDRKSVLRIINKGSTKNKEEIDKVIKILQESGSIKYAKNKAEEYMKNARESIKNLQKTDAKDTLLSLADIKTDEWYWSKNA